MAAKQQHLRQHLIGSSRFVGLSQDYPPLASAASFSSPNKKWSLNSKNDVVEVPTAADGSYHHTQPHFVDSSENLHQQQQQGFMGAECGRLMRYNSAPSCLFSDLDQLARSLNDPGNPPQAQIFSAANDQQQQQLPPLPMPIMDKRNLSPQVDLISKKKSGGGAAASSSRFSTPQSSIVTLGMDFDHHQRGDQQQNGFTGLLTGSSATASNNNLLKNSSAAATATTNLARQGSSPSGLLSRLEIEHGATGSSEEDSPLMRSPINDQDGSPSVVDCGYWDGNASGNVAAAVAAVQHAQTVAAAAAQLHQQIHGGVYINGSSTSESRKRIRDVDMDIVEAAAMDHHNQQQQQQQQQHTLTRHLSLPISSRSSGGLENLLQDSVPCRLRAKRGCATHPRSIAERVRRTRISERMRRLQELVPNMDKQTNMSDMLDEAAEYMKFLQKKVEELEECRDKCQGLCKMSQSAALNHPS